MVVEAGKATFPRESPLADIHARIYPKKALGKAGLRALQQEIRAASSHVFRLLRLPKKDIGAEP